jgi:hypothetical protein
MFHTFCDKGYVGIAQCNALIPVFRPWQVISLSPMSALCLMLLAANDRMGGACFQEWGKE